ncbi:hypothetical protein ACMGE6_09445 [Macrococcus equi]|uniref:hypothetical protein n=1 Tax=Macrococcus equi TaxID=3395462 RepID=UPI0039BDF1D9
MSTGFIIFIIFSVISLVSSLIEKSNKEKNPNVKRKVSTTQQGSKQVMKQIQTTMESLEKEFTEFKKHPEAMVNENERRLTNDKKQNNNIKRKAQNKASELKDEKQQVERSAAKKIQAFEEKIVAKEKLSLAERIAKVEADPHLSPRQKMNRINMIRMENDIDNAGSIIDFTPENTLKGIIYSEILGPPKARR